jgi:charged multivesicular body protein 4
LYPLAIQAQVAHRLRDKLREQQQLSDEIATAISSNPLVEQPDEDELEEELERLEQSAMDERMLHTGTVPVADQLNRLPAASNAERKSAFLHLSACEVALWLTSPFLSTSRQSETTSRRIRRGSRVGKITGGNGHVMTQFLPLIILSFSFSRA